MKIETVEAMIGGYFLLATAAIITTGAGLIGVIIAEIWRLV